MTDPRRPSGVTSPGGGESSEGDQLDGHTLEELSDYLDHGCTPRDESIEQSAACRIALSDLRRLQTLSGEFLDHAATSRPDREEQWIAGILSRISLTAHAGRDLPLSEATSDGGLVLTEGGLKSLIRTAGDRFPGFLIGRVTFTGDLSSPTAAIAIRVEVDVLHGIPIASAASGLRAAIADAVRLHTRFHLDRIDIAVQDLQQPDPATP